MKSVAIFIDTNGNVDFRILTTKEARWMIFIRHMM